MSAPRTILRYFFGKALRKTGVDYPTARFVSLKLIPWGRKR